MSSGQSDAISEPVRVAPSQGDRIAEVLAAAFHDDPLYRRIFPDIEERSQTLRRLFGAVVVYDATRKETQDSVQEWTQSIWAHSTYPEKIPIALLANKMDLKDQIAAKTTSGKKLAENLASKRRGPVPYFETSAKTGHLVKEAFEELGRLVIEFTDKLPVDSE